MALSSSEDQNAAEAVASTLSAPDLYRAIGASRDSSDEEVQRCYLQTAVRVHPYKNHQKDASLAFQRASAALSILGHPSLRQRYNYELQVERARAAGTGGCRGCEPEWQSMRPEDAFDIFARVTATSMGSADASNHDLGDTLIMAQYLSLRQGGSTYQFQNNKNDQGTAAAAGAKSLPSEDAWAAGSFVRALGSSIFGCDTEQVNSDERVSDTRAGDAKKVRQRRSEQASTSRHAPACFSKNCTVPLSHALSKLMHVATASEPEEASDEECSEVGLAVRLVGLSSASNLNGRIGKVLGRDESSGRIKVELFRCGEHDLPATGIKLIKCANLERACERSASPPDGPRQFI